MATHPKPHGSHRTRNAPKSKSGRQVRFLFSKGSPLEPGQKSKLADELRSGAVRVRGGKSQIANQPRRRRRARGPLEPR